MIESKRYKDKRTGEIVTQIPILEIFHKPRVILVWNGQK